MPEERHGYAPRSIHGSVVRVFARLTSGVIPNWVGRQSNVEILGATVRRGASVAYLKCEECESFCELERSHGALSPLQLINCSIHP